MKTCNCFKCCAWRREYWRLWFRVPWWANPFYHKGRERE